MISDGLEGLEGRKYRPDPLAGNKPIYLQLHVHYVSNIPVIPAQKDLSTVLHVVLIHINISIYYSVLHHVRILDKSLSGTRSQVL
jgi:hypothetical protein